LAVGILLVLHIHFLRGWFAHIVDMLGVIEESQKYRNHEAPRSTRKVLVATHSQYWRKNTSKQRASNYCNWSLSYGSIK